MSALRAWFWRLGALLGKQHRDEELNEELESHLQFQIEDNLRAGMPPQEARRQALIKLGGVEQTKEVCRDRRGIPWLESLWRDIHFGLRMLNKNPGVTTAALLTLALGIGVNTAIFSIADAVLLHPLPFRDPGRLFVLHEAIPKLGYPKLGFSAPDFAIFAREQKSFETIGAFRNERVDISGQGEPDRVVAARMSPALFPMLGAQPMIGRTFAPDEDAPGIQVVILSYGLWQRRYGGLPNVIGQRIGVDRLPYTIIGVMPRAFTFPWPGPEKNASPADLWLPLAFTPAELQDWGGTYVHTVVGRLRPGATLHQALDEARVLSHTIVANYPGAIANVFDGMLAITAVSFQQEVVGSVRTLLLVLVAAAAFILLISCANVSTLLLCRAAARQREIAIRSAFGATRLRLVRQMLSESVLLALGGGTLGLVLAFWARSLVLALVPASIPLPRQIPVSGHMLGSALAACFLAPLLFGLVPAFQISQVPEQHPLQERVYGGTAGRAPHRLQRFFVTAEFGLAVVLVMGAGLSIRSFAKLLETNPGFQTDHVLTINVPLPRNSYPHASQIANFYKQLLGRISILPGAQSAGLASDLPLNTHEMVSIVIERQGKADDPTPKAIAQTWILGDYFQTMGIPVLRGRWFGPEDRLESQPVAIVSSSMARKFWPGQDAIGKRIRWGVAARWATIVGIVGDVSQGLLNTSVIPQVYRPYDQLPGGFLEEDLFADWRAMNVIVRTYGNPAFLASASVAQVHSLDPDLPITGVQTATQLIGSSIVGPEFNMVLLVALACLALFLAATGIYGVLSYAVSQQTREIGIHMALGANPRNVHGMILRRGVRLVGVGAAFGIAASLGLTRFMRALLYGVSPTDPVTFAAIMILFAFVALAACYIPARRAMSVDPAVALRYE